jgi:cytochrome c biogenesis protein CcmG/thiol:disulfide interchange protein DsbE
MEHRNEPQDGTPSPPESLIGLPVPNFSLPSLGGGPALSSADFAATGRPVLLNFFASWCGPCQREVPLLLDLHRKGLTIWGIAFRDQPTATEAFLHQRGNPYQRIARDDVGRMTDAFALPGIPVSFLVGPDGIIRWVRAGELTPDVIARSLTPHLKATS